MANRQDQRYQKTDKRIIDAFIQLLNRKSFTNIKVKEIIELAQINKSTFYAHYLDKYDLLDKVENRLVEGFKIIAAKIPQTELINLTEKNVLTKYYQMLADYIWQNHKLFRTLVVSNKSQVIEELIQLGKNYWRLPANSILFKIPFNYVEAGTAYMVVGLIENWCQSNFDISSEEFAQILLQMSQNIRRALITSN